MTLREGERIDELNRRGYRIIQNPNGFCFGVDAVLLAWFAEVREGEQVADLGSGTGIVPLLMDARNGCGTYVGVELQEDMAEMAGRSAALNGAESRIRFVSGDLCEASALLGRASFDAVTANPPYIKAGDGILNPDDGRAIARHELLCSLTDVLREGAALLREGGRFYMIHRPERLPEILEGMRAYRLAPSRLLPVCPKPGKDAAMVLISGTKGGHDRLRILPQLTLRAEDGELTAEARAIYED